MDQKYLLTEEEYNKFTKLQEEFDYLVGRKVEEISNTPFFEFRTGVFLGFLLFYFIYLFVWGVRCW